MLGVTNGYVKLIGRYEALPGILKLPPELVTDGGNFNCVWREARIFHRMDDSRCGQKQHHDNQDGNDRPGQLHLVAAIDLRWLSAIVEFRPAMTTFRSGTANSFHGWVRSKTIPSMSR